MTREHLEIFRALAAAQVALIEHVDEEIRKRDAKSALLRCLSEATHLTRKLEE